MVRKYNLAVLTHFRSRESDEIKQFKHLLNPGKEDLDAGVFYMNIKDFINHFHALTVNYYHPKYYHSSIRTKSINHKKVTKLRFKVKVPGVYYCMVSQPCGLLQEEDSGPLSEPGISKEIRLFEKIEKKNPKSKTWIMKEGKQNSTKEVFVKAFLKPGEYEIRLRCDENLFFSEMGVCVYGPEQVSLDHYKCQFVGTQYKRCVKDISRAINLIRTKPQSLIPSLEDRKKTYEFKNLENGTKKVEFLQNGVVFEALEGTEVIDECIERLRQTQALSELQRDVRLDAAAQEVIAYNQNAEEAKILLRSMDHSNLRNTVQAQMDYGEHFSNIEGNLGIYCDNGHDYVLSWMINDKNRDQENRLMRNRILNPTFTKFGIACGIREKTETKIKIALVIFARPSPVQDLENRSTADLEQYHA